MRLFAFISGEGPVPYFGLSFFLKFAGVLTTIVYYHDKASHSGFFYGDLVLPALQPLFRDP